MGVMNHVSAFITHRFDELYEPDRGVNGDTPAAKCANVDAPACGLKEIPQTFDTHLCSLSANIKCFRRRYSCQSLCPPCGSLLCIESNFLIKIVCVQLTLNTSWMYHVDHISKRQQRGRIYRRIRELVRTEMENLWELRLSLRVSRREVTLSVVPSIVPYYASYIITFVFNDGHEIALKSRYRTILISLK